MKKYLVTLLILTFSVNNAQFEDVFASDSDAVKFITGYTQPVFKGLMYATGGAWITSAKPIKPFHVEFNISASGAFVTPSHENFKLDPADYKYLSVESGPNEIPTVMGGESHSRLLIEIPDEYNTEVKTLEFDAPDGIKDELPVNAIPAPAIQLSLGLPLGSEVNLRYAPKITYNNGFLQLLGIGVKHSISQYFPVEEDEDGKKKKRHFNVAVHAAYQNISTGYDDEDSDKGVRLNISTISLQGIASFDYKFLSVYGAVGYNKGFTNLDVIGTYEYTYEVKDNNGNHVDTKTVSIKDPLKLKYDINAPKAKAGVKLKLAFFQIFADYTLQEYPVATAGFGFKF